MRKFTRKRYIGVLAAIAVLAMAGAAVAFFTSTGNGTGSANVGTAGGWAVGQTGSTGGPLYPDAAIGGANVQTSQYSVTNNGKGSQKLSQVVIKVANSDGSAWSSQTNVNKPACTANDFSVGGQTVGTAWTDTSLSGDYTTGQVNTGGNVTVEMIDNGKNQDNCQGVSVPLYFNAS